MVHVYKCIFNSFWTDEKRMNAYILVVCLCVWVRERDIYRDANWKIIGLLEYVEKEKQATERAKEEKKKRLQKESENV